MSLASELHWNVDNVLVAYTTDVRLHILGPCVAKLKIKVSLGSQLSLPGEAPENIDELLDDESTFDRQSFCCSKVPQTFLEGMIYDLLYLMIYRLFIFLNIDYNFS